MEKIQNKLKRREKGEDDWRPSNRLAFDWTYLNQNEPYSLWQETWDPSEYMHDKVHITMHGVPLDLNASDSWMTRFNSWVRDLKLRLFFTEEFSWARSEFHRHVFIRREFYPYLEPCLLCSIEKSDDKIAAEIAVEVLGLNWNHFDGHWKNMTKNKKKEKTWRLASGDKQRIFFVFHFLFLGL